MQRAIGGSIVAEQRLGRRNVELKRFQIPDAALWWTFDLEAFGPLSTVTATLEATAHALAGATLVSHPAWPAERLA